ncbi:hypothetical protein SAY86_004084 [Trapa natans]|uniref:Uncharacterized protein n=1 Tax=Trapa natans TaxID=22666 RepID=A0AAN7MF81_TRANT|nr:hypothetical protein SAY86_004084 [Trapa natans]
MSEVEASPGKKKAISLKESHIDLHLPGFELEWKFTFEPRKSLNDLGADSHICSDSKQEERKEEKGMGGFHGYLKSEHSLRCSPMALQVISSFDGCLLLLHFASGTKYVYKDLDKVNMLWGSLYRIKEMFGGLELELHEDYLYVAKP